MPLSMIEGDALARPSLQNVLEQIQCEIVKLSSVLRNEDAGAADVNAQLSELRLRCESAITDDIRNAVELKVEDDLWDFHSRVNNWYRSRFKLLQGLQQQCVAERKLSKRYSEFIKAGQKCYQDHIQKLAVQHGGIPELEAVALEVSVEELEKKYEGMMNPQFRPIVLNSCFYALIRLGDLSRWKESRREDGEANWAPAIGFYDLASTIRPDSGYPHNQLAVIAAAKKDTLGVILHFYRALTAQHPHPTAQKNLDLEFKKIMATALPIERHPGYQGYDPGTHKQIIDNLIGWFMQLHEKCRGGTVLVEQEELEGRVIGYLTVNIQEIFMPWITVQIIMVNLLAEYAAVQRAEATLTAPFPTPALVQTRFYFLKLNIKIFYALLNLLYKDICKNAEVADWAGKPAMDRVSTIMRRVLPSLRVYSSWLIWSMPALTKPLGQGKFYERLKQDLKKMWSIYIRAMNILVTYFAREDLPAIEYLLEEDMETLGFVPFQTSLLTHRFLKPDMARKPARHNVKRHHPQLEMLGRIRDIVTDAMKISNQEGCPFGIPNKEDDRPIFKFLPLSKPMKTPVGSPMKTPDTSPVRTPMKTPTKSPGKSPMKSPGFNSAGFYNLTEPALKATSDTSSEASFEESVNSKHATSEVDMECRFEKMVDDLVGVDTTPKKPYFNYPNFKPPVLDGSARPKTPPACYYEDKTSDINPYAPTPEPGNYDHLFISPAMQWLKDTIEAGQLEGRRTIGDNFYRTPRA